MPLLHIISAVLVAVLWGGNYVAAKYGIAWFPPFLLSSVRFILVSLMLLPFVGRPGLRQIRRILPISVMSTLHFSLLFVALYQGLDIASAALVGQLGVPFACLFGAIFLEDKIGPWRILGIVIAFGGTAVLAGAPNIAAHWKAFYLALGSAFSWGVANVLIKRLSDIGSQQLLAWVSLCVVPMLFALSLIFEKSAWPPLTLPPLSALSGLTYTAVASTVIAYGLWYYLLSRHNVSQVTPFSLLTPVFGIAFGQLFFAEELTKQVLLGGAITIIGVAVIVVRRPKTIILGEAT